MFLLIRPAARGDRFLTRRRHERRPKACFIGPAPSPPARPIVALANPALAVVPATAPPATAAPAPARDPNAAPAPQSSAAIPAGNIGPAALHFDPLSAPAFFHGPKSAGPGAKSHSFARRSPPPSRRT